MKIFIKVFSIILSFYFHLFTLSLSPTTENLKQILFKLSQKELLPCKFWGKYCEIWLTTEPRAIKAVHENFTITIFASALERIVHSFALWLNWEKRSTIMIGWKWEKQSMENFRAACLPSTLSRTRPGVMAIHHCMALSCRSFLGSNSHAKRPRKWRTKGLFYLQNITVLIILLCRFIKGYSIKRTSCFAKTEYKILIKLKIVQNKI